MTPVKPLMWIGTTTPNRDQGLFHLVAVTMVNWGGRSSAIAVASAACGAKPFAYSGSFPDSGPIPGQKCQRCEAMAKGLR